jgi:hypothetical protein
MFPGATSQPRASIGAPKSARQQDSEITQKSGNFQLFAALVRKAGVVVIVSALALIVRSRMFGSLAQKAEGRTPHIASMFKQLP